MVTPDSAWTGESNWRGAYVLAESGDTVRFTLAGAARDAVSAGGATAHPVLHRAADEAGTATWIALDADGAATVLGSFALGGIGDPGLTEWDGVLKPIPLETEIPAGTTAIQVEVDGRLELDELMLLPATKCSRPTTPGPRRSRT